MSEITTENKTVLITGASGGIGKEMVLRFAKGGYNIIFCCRKGSEELDKELNEIALENNIIINQVHFDLSDEASVKEALKGVLTKTSVDVVINNAGVSCVGLFEMTPMANLENTMKINYIMPLLISQMAARYMKRKKKGVIINIASVSGVDNEIGGIAYGSSKAALIFASRTMAMELGKYGIRVNCISPGFIDTNMWKGREEELIAANINKTPLHRQGKPEEVAELAWFLASDSAQYITGQNYLIDGGGRCL